MLIHLAILMLLNLNYILICFLELFRFVLFHSCYFSVLFIYCPVLIDGKLCPMYYVSCTIVTKLRINKHETSLSFLQLYSVGNVKLALHNILEENLLSVTLTLGDFRRLQVTIHL